MNYLIINLLINKEKNLNYDFYLYFFKKLIKIIFKKVVGQS